MTRTHRQSKNGSHAKACKDGMTPQMWARLRGKTNDEVLAAARKDPNARPIEDGDPIIYVGPSPSYYDWFVSREISHGFDRVANSVRYHKLDELA